MNSTVMLTAEPAKLKQAESLDVLVHPKIGVYRLTVLINAREEVSKLEVRSAKLGKLIQSVKTSGKSCSENCERIMSVDLNFDGYQDIMIRTWAGATGNIGYEVWIFNKLTRQFDYNKTLSDKSNPTPDPKTKIVSTHMRGGHMGFIFTHDKYKYIKGKFVLVESASQGWAQIGGSKYKLITQIYKDGKVLETKTGIIDYDNEDIDFGK